MTTEVTKGKQGRKPYPRDENGQPIRPADAKPRAAKVADHAPLTFADGVLYAGEAAFDGVQWIVGGYTAHNLTAEVEATRKALEVLEALAGQVNLPNPNEFDPKKALKVYGVESQNFDALVDYWRHTRTTAK